MPVLPLVGSISVSPGLMRPSFSASSTIAQADAVLDRAAGVEELALRVQVALEMCADAVELDEGRAADGVEDGVEQHAGVPGTIVCRPRGCGQTRVAARAPARARQHARQESCNGSLADAGFLGSRRRAHPRLRRHRAADVPREPVPADPVGAHHAPWRRAGGPGRAQSGRRHCCRNAGLTGGAVGMVLAGPAAGRAAAAATGGAPWPLAGRDAPGPRPRPRLARASRRAGAARGPPRADGPHPDLAACGHGPRAAGAVPRLLPPRHDRVDHRASPWPAISCNRGSSRIRDVVGPVSTAILVVLVGWYVWRVATYRTRQAGEAPD